MIHKRKSVILSIFFIFLIQILLLINNRQKTSFRYFIWEVEEISIGRLVFISFISGLLMSSILNKTLQENNRIDKKKEAHETKNDEEDFSIKNDENDKSFEMPPQRDLRETQPTISVNYRIIQDKVEKELKDRNQAKNNYQYDDDWNDKDSEW